ncbi:MAG TPA: hypothetical protein VGT98_11380, partial [Candidatus Elarobacter sp.]|nr:hypothetical protein [Candidatus Elarobacter sp.]
MQTTPPVAGDVLALDKVTLAASTVVEPLVANWCAFSYLLPPVTASLYFTNYQLALLNSYIEQPESHAKAAADPHLSGGPFVNIAPSRIADVVRLRDDSLRVFDENKKLAEELAAFLNAFAVDAADGLAIAPWYGRVSERFRPFVELVYDYHHRPHVRFIEPLTYHSPLYRRESQGLRVFSLNRDTDRPYFMNTPRLPGGGGGEQFFSTPFDTDACKAITELSSAPLAFSELRERLELTDEDAESLAQLLVPAAPVTARRPSNVYTYLGHASVMTHWKGTTVI